MYERTVVRLTAPYVRMTIGVCVLHEHTGLRRGGTVGSLPPIVFVGAPQIDPHTSRCKAGFTESSHTNLVESSVPIHRRQRFG